MLNRLLSALLVADAAVTGWTQFLTEEPQESFAFIAQPCDSNCKDTKPESECADAAKNWNMCETGGPFWEDQCKKTCKKCTVCQPTPAPTLAPDGRRRRRGAQPPQPQPPTPAPDSSRRRGTGGGGTCQCAKSTTWDGSFGQYVDGKDFCSQGWGGANPYVCAGGGTAGAATSCSSDICSSGQYTFTREEGWKIIVDKGGMPYRAFAFVKFCNGQQIGSCWESEPMTFSFSFKTEGMMSVKSFVKLFFWTDNGNMVGLLGPPHPKSGGQYKLITFMPDDFPNKWQDETVIEDGAWYHLTIDFTPSTKAVGISLNGKKFSNGSIPVNMLTDQNGPQIGTYIFGPGSLKMWINDVCVGQASGTCPSGTAPSPPSAPPTSPPAPPPSGGGRRRSQGRRRSTRRRRRSSKTRRRRRRSSKTRRRRR